MSFGEPEAWCCFDLRPEPSSGVHALPQDDRYHTDRQSPGTLCEQDLSSWSGPCWGGEGGARRLLPRVGSLLQVGLPFLSCISDLAPHLLRMSLSDSFTF